MTEPLTFLDFFSGVGGFRKGFELCGMVCKGHCEIDKFADRSYRAIHDIQEDEWYGEDITKTEPADLPRVNLWAGGFPCQDISVSGRQRGLAGKRSSLFFEIIRLLKGMPTEDRPEWLVLENVKNLLSVNRGWDFATVLYSLAEIGYHIEYGLLNSRFHGVPQNRERIYLVAYRHFRADGGRKIFPVTASDGKALIQLIGGTQGKVVVYVENPDKTTNPKFYTDEDMTEQVIRIRLFGSLEKTRKITGFRALYFHYCYLLGIFPKNNPKQNKRRLHFLLREDLRKLDDITAETRLLVGHRIDTAEQLFSYQSEAKDKITALTAERKQLYKLQRTAAVKADPEKAAEIKEQISTLSKELATLRKEVSLCDDIAERSGVIKEKIKAVRKDEQPERKEKNDHVQFR